MLLYEPEFVLIVLEMFLVLYSVAVQSDLERVKFLPLQVAATFHASYFSAETRS